VESAMIAKVHVWHTYTHCPYISMCTNMCEQCICMIHIVYVYLYVIHTISIYIYTEHYIYSLEYKTVRSVEHTYHMLYVSAPQPSKLGPSRRIIH
jgi:hypothetical protein